MITKTQILSVLENLPEELTLEELIYRLEFIEKVEKGLEDSDNGRTYSSEEAKVRLGKWLK